MLLGFTTGKPTHLSLVEKVNCFRELGCNAIELSILDVNRFEIFEESLSDLHLDNFLFRSVHAPCFCLDAGVKIKTIYKNDSQTLDILNKVSWMVKNFQADLVVIHPDLVEDWSVFEQFDLPVAVENMDWKKDRYKTLGDFKILFETIDAKMVLDVNHSFTNDPTAELAVEMFANFGERIKEIHLSGFDKYHEPLHTTKQVEIVKSMPKKDVPIIIESTCQTVEEYKKEYQYVVGEIKNL